MTLAQRNLPYSTFNQATSRELHVRAASPLPLGVAIDPPLHHKAFATPDNISPWQPRCYYATQRTIHLQTQRSLSRKGGVDLTRSCLRVFPCVFGCLFVYACISKASGREVLFRDCLHRSSRRAVHLLSGAARLLSSCKNHLGTLQETLQPLLAALLMVVTQQNTIGIETPTQTEITFLWLSSSLHG